MTSASPTPARDAGRTRDAARTRTALLDAARRLFGHQGYDRTTLRDIAELAGVDPALIARYFGGKGGIYVASLDDVEPAPADGRQDADEGFLEGLIERTMRRGPGPLLQAAVTPACDPAVAAAARRILAARILAPVRARADAAGLDRPQLRAELAAAALAGVALARAAGVFDVLASVDQEEAVRLTLDMLEGIAGVAVPHPPDGHPAASVD